MRAMLLVALAAVAAQGRGETELRQVWRLKLSGIDDIVSLRYSPGGQWIAAVTSRITAEGDRREVLLVPASGDASGVKRIALSHQHVGKPRQKTVVLLSRKSSRTILARIEAKTGIHL